MTTLGDERRLQNVLEALAVARTCSPVEADLCAERIQFAVSRIGDLRQPTDDAPVRVDRVLMAEVILDQHLGRAEAFLDLISSGILVRHVA